MYVIGELINGMYKKVASAIQERNKDYIKALARRQTEAGCDALDVNCGPLSRDVVSDMRWLVETIQEEVSTALCLDSTKTQAIEEGLKAARSKVIINSTSAEAARLEILVPMAKKYKASLIALAMDRGGVPQDKEKKLILAATILEYAQQNDFALDELYVDPILAPINIAQGQLFGILELIKDIKMMASPAARTVVGLSNISQGSKQRSLINRTFLVMAQGYGLDAAILDPLDKDLMDSLITAGLILNKNIYCDSYLDAYRKSKKGH